MGELIEYLALRQYGNVLTLFGELFNQLEGLRTIYCATRSTEVGDIRFQLCIETGVVVAKYQLVCSNFALWNSGEVDALNRTILDYRFEVIPYLFRSGRGVPIKAYADGLRYRLGANTSLTLAVVGVEREAHQQGLVACLAVAF